MCPVGLARFDGGSLDRIWERKRWFVDLAIGVKRHAVEGDEDCDDIRMSNSRRDVEDSREGTL